MADPGRVEIPAGAIADSIAVSQATVSPRRCTTRCVRRRRPTPASRQSCGREADRRQGCTGDDVEPEVVAGHEEREPDPRRPEQERNSGERRPRDGGERDAQHERVGGMQARHRGVGIRECPDEAGMERHRAGRECVRVAGAGQKPRRCGRKCDIADETDDVDGEDRVAQERVGPVVPHVDPGHGDGEERELGEPVRPVGELDEGTADAQGEPLEIEVVEPAQVVLDRDDSLRVRQREGRAAVGEPAGQLVGKRKAGPERELLEQISTASWEGHRDCSVAAPAASCIRLFTEPRRANDAAGCGFPTRRGHVSPMPVRTGWVMVIPAAAARGW